MLVRALLMADFVLLVRSACVDFITPLLGRPASVSRVCAASRCSTPRRCVGSTPMLLLVQVLGTS